jgi:hypothetical protein
MHKLPAATAEHAAGMRTSVRIGPRPWKPAVELDGALDRGDLPYAITLAHEVAEDRPLDLRLAARFLPIVAMQRTEQYDAWAKRWFVRWLNETPRPRIDTAAEIAGALEELPIEPVAAMDAIRTLGR